MAIYLGANLLTGGGSGSSSSEQEGAVDLTSLALWNGDYTDYNNIGTKDASTVYFVSGSPSNFAASGFTISQTGTAKNTTLTPIPTITFSVALTPHPVDDFQGDISGYTFKWWVPSGATGADFDIDSASIGTSQATATAVTNPTIVHNSTTEGTFTVNVAVFDASNTQVGSAQAFTPVAASGTVTLTISSSYGGASFFWQCGGPSVSGTVAYNGSIRVGGEVDPDQAVSQSYSKTTGDAVVSTERCYNWSDGFGYRMYGRYQNSHINCSFSA